MRIRRSGAAAASSMALPSSCSSSSTSSCFSSSTTHSTISTHSPTTSSSSNSTSSAASISAARHRCQGLDLLVKAVYHVAGSVVGVPYIQRRVIRRRKRAVRFTNFVIHLKDDDDEVQIDDGEMEDDEEEEGEVFDCGKLEAINLKMKMKMKKQNQKKMKTKRSMAVPSKYQDSVLQSWKPKNRRRRRSGE